MNEIEIRVARLPHGADLPLPAYQSKLASGCDLLAAIPHAQPIVIAPGARAAIPTGIVLALPPGAEGQVRPRSGLAAKSGVTVLNTPGTIDSDYRGEVQVLVVNLSDVPAVVAPLDRVAQLVIAPIARAELALVGELPKTPRGAGGYGSTGGK